MVGRAERFVREKNVRTRGYGEGSPPIRFTVTFCGSLLPELHGHLVLAAGEGAGADDFARVGAGAAAGAEDREVADLADGERVLQQERHAAERLVAGEDFVA